MKILYSGCFLGEGLRQAGHEVIPLRLDEGASFLELVEAACPQPDLILLELWGKTALPADIGACPFRLAIYGIDAPLNAFWLTPLAAVCDDLFVDQLSCVAPLSRQGRQAQWLPLCVSEADFQTPQPKEHFLTFVGRTTRFRPKRQNLLRLLTAHYPVHIVQDIPPQEMLALFAHSRVVLNENLFSGLTLRVLQGLASGALLLTERGGLGVDRFFTDGEHLVTFDADDVLTRLGAIAANGTEDATIARRGQQACREGHTSRVRAREFLMAIREGSARAPRQEPAVRRLAEATARYRHALRYGGSFSQAMAVFCQTADRPDRLGYESRLCLGSIYARNGLREPAQEAFRLAAAADGALGFLAAAKLATTFLDQDDWIEAAAIIRQAQANLPPPHKAPPHFGTLPNPKQAILLFITTILADLDMVFDLGFLKARQERSPDYAFEYARLAWDAAHTPDALDAIITCATRCDAQADILPLLREAITEGVATDKQILFTAELANRLYDKPLAQAIARSFRRQRPAPRPIPKRSEA